MKKTVILFFVIVLGSLRVTAQTQSTLANRASDSLKKTIPEMRRANHGLSAQPSISGSETPTKPANTSTEQIRPDTTKRLNKNTPQIQKQQPK